MKKKTKLKFYEIKWTEKHFRSVPSGKYRLEHKESSTIRARLDIRDVETFGLSIAYRKYALCKAMGIGYPCLSGVAFTARNSGKFIHRG
ncbi:MAG: hypothetical protein MJ109_07205 [Kiritimatiellae bacterium]|nr:hypothetical protein [Kiritimatiellia bacterium]